MWLIRDGQNPVIGQKLSAVGTTPELYSYHLLRLGTIRKVGA